MAVGSEAGRSLYHGTRKEQGMVSTHCREVESIYRGDPFYGG